jgi:hypothetical protein
MAAAVPDTVVSGANRGASEGMDSLDNEHGDCVGWCHWIRSSELSAQVYAEIRGIAVGGPPTDR